jgi:predicted DNA-binding antitoxin AbrB/MazE fold protein
MSNRREKRRMFKQLGILKKLSKLQFMDPTKVEFRKRNRAEGKAKHEKMVEELENARYERLEHLSAAYLAKMKEEGYNTKELTLLEEAFALKSVKTETYRADRKKAKELETEALASMENRNKK